MNIGSDNVAIVAGGVSGLGNATVRALTARISMQVNHK